MGFLFCFIQVHSPDNDPIVSLTTTVFNALEVVSVEPDSPQFAQCSPQVTESLLWFLERWSETYLFLRSTSHAPQSLVRAFGKEGGGPRVLEFVLGMVHRAVVCWCGEVDVLTQIVSLLNGLSKSGDVREALLNSGELVLKISGERGVKADTRWFGNKRNSGS